MRPANETGATRDVHILDNVTANKSVEDADGTIWPQQTTACIR